MESWEEWKWRPVYGQITRVDRSLVTPADVDELFSESGIVTRGRHDGDAFRFEIATTGRRRRLATLVRDEDGNESIRPTVHLADFVDSLADKQHHIEISVDGIHRYPPLSLGEVDITDEDLNPESLQSQAVPADTDEDNWIYAHIAANGPLFHDGPMLAISDSPFSAVPALAAKSGAAIAVAEHEGANVMLADAPMIGTDYVTPSSSFVILLSADPKGGDAPVLATIQGRSMATWNWDTDVVDMPWVEGSNEASHFAHREMGAGALVSRITEDLSFVAPGELEAALTAPADRGVSAFLKALHLSAQVDALMSGTIGVDELADVHVFKPQQFAQRIQEQIAYEVNGQGVAPSKLWDIYRAVYLEDPRLVRLIAAGQAGIGLAGMVWGARNWRSKGAKVAASVGAALVVSAAGRIATSAFVGDLLRAQGLEPRAE